jgi:mannose-6-phosphate isomerase-like protein (cupin superfamily)
MHRKKDETLHVTAGKGKIVIKTGRLTLMKEIL